MSDVVITSQSGAPGVVAGNYPVVATQGPMAHKAEIQFQYTLRIRPSLAANPLGLDNYISVAGEDSSNRYAFDRSDDGTNPIGVNAGFSGDTGGYDDPTPFVAPALDLQKRVSNVAPTGNGLEFAATFEFTLENQGQATLSNLSISDDLLSQATVSSVSSVSTVSVLSSGGASCDSFVPGTDFLQNTTAIAITGSNCVLAPAATVTVTVQANFVLDQSAGDRVLNSAIASATDSTGSVISDTSDGDGNPSEDTDATGFPAAGPNDNASNPSLVLAASLDFGDAPASYGTLVADGGAAHAVTPQLYLGNTVADSEADGQPSSEADGDNLNGTNDEDGVVSFNRLPVDASSYSVEVSLHNSLANAQLVAWIDFNRNNVFDSGEAATTSVSVGANSATLTWNGIFGLSEGYTYARFRLTTDNAVATGLVSSSSATGVAGDGEVEDYRLLISPTDIDVCSVPMQFVSSANNNVAEGKLGWSNGDASNRYNNVNGRGFDMVVEHLDANTLNPLGALFYHDSDPLQQVNATGSNGASDSRLYRFTFFDTASGLPLDVNNFRFVVEDFESPERIRQMQLFGSNGGTATNVNFQSDAGLIAFSGSPVFEDSGNTLLGYYASDAGVASPEKWLVVSGSPSGQAYHRWEFVAQNAGQVPLIGLCKASSADYGDSPASYGVASHEIRGNQSSYLGSQAPDAENDLVAAGFDLGTGDDSNATDDEDAVSTLPALTTIASSYSISAVCTGSGNGSAWIDFNRNGSYDNGERALASCNAGSMVFTWDAANGNAPVFTNGAGESYGRIRMASSAAEISSPVGLASDGEVEGFAISIVDTDFGDAPDTYSTNLTAGDSGSDITGAHHALSNQLFIGATVDAENNGFAGSGADVSGSALDDDNTGADEDGLSAALPRIDGGYTSYSIPANGITVVNSSGESATLHAWIDFNRDGQFSANEYASQPVSAGASQANAALSWSGISPVQGASFLRLRLTTDSLSDNAGTTALDERATGFAGDGEVEDHSIIIEGAKDFGDAPQSYNTLLADNGQATALAPTCSWVRLLPMQILMVLQMALIQAITQVTMTPTEALMKTVWILLIPSKYLKLVQLMLASQNVGILM